MSLVSTLRTLADFLFHRRRMEREMDEEFRSHLALRMADLERQGVARSDAERQARIEFGGYQNYKEECRETLGTRLLQELWQDISYGFRQLRRNPGFTAVAVLTLALGIGANTAIFSVVNGVLLEPLPYYEPQQIVQISMLYRGQPRNMDFSARQFDFWKSHAVPFQDLAATTEVGFNLGGASRPERVRALRVTSDYFRLLGVAPAMGREFLREEDRIGGRDVAILSHALWEREFGANPKVIGRSITLDGAPFTVIGVMPAGFESPTPSRPVDNHWPGGQNYWWRQQLHGPGKAQTTRYS